MRREVSRALAGVVLASLLLRAPLAAADPLEEAREHFRAGVAFLQDPDGPRYEEAYAQFKKAYEVSKSPKVLGNLGLCAMKLERDGEAIEAYTRYLTEVSDIEELERAQVTQDLQTLKASVSRLWITVEVRGAADPTAPMTIHDTRVVARGAPVSNVYPVTGKRTELTVRPGHHSMTIKAGGRSSASWDFDVSPGARLAHTFVVGEPPPPVTRPEPSQPPPAPRSSGSSRIGPIVVTSIGAGALVAGAIVGIVTLGKIDDLESGCPGDACPPDKYADVDATRDWVRATDFLLLGGAVVTAVGVGWFFLSPSNEPSTGPRASVRARARCIGNGCGASLRVGF